MKRSRMAAPLLIALAVPAGAQDWQADWWTVDGGGELEARGGSWTLSGTIGQWDATGSDSAQGGPWEITGGFWGVNSETDLLFKDGYET